MYVYLAKFVTVYTKIEVGCKCPTKGDSEYGWEWILLPNIF